MLFKDKKEEALGGNFKLKDIKVFGSKENLYQNIKKYRKVFDETEARYIYCELSFYNKLFDESDWEVDLSFVCYNQISGEKVCSLEKKVEVSKDKNIVYVREGWGTPKTGWWKSGKYRWELLQNEKAIGAVSFYIVNGGLVSESKNAYFGIKSAKLFESSKIGIPFGQREYLSVFPVASTRYVNVELILDNFRTSDPIFPLELQFNLYNDAGQQKGFMSFFKEITDKAPKIILDTGYGSDKLGYWYEDHYSMEIIFMDQLIGVIPFRMAKDKRVSDESMVMLEDVALEAIEEKVKKLSFEEAKENLEKLIGLKSVKAQINELASYLQFLKIRKEKGLEEDQEFSLHSIFTGNPGTGKTTVAHMLGKIYHSLGLLSHGKVHEVGRADLVGEFIGQTAPKVKKVLEKARGGILFIDEAYSLTNRGDDGKDFGKEVIEVLLKELSDKGGNVAIIFAGYPKEMTQFINSNPGLASRLRNKIHFPDYTPEELIEITEYTAKKRGVLISEPAKEMIHKKLVEVYRNRDEQFGNARYINGIVDEAKQNMALRLMAEASDLENMDQADLSTILIDDIRKVFIEGLDEQVQLPIDEALLEDALTQLHDLVGLDNIKTEVDEMSKLVRYYREIGKDIRKAFSLHTVFKGNPGTGKTTIARLIVQIYKALGILSRGHLVEVDRKTLVAGFVGQTAIKTGEMIDSAIGGGLFIDEAYSLTKGGTNDFGREAIEILLKRMEDQRGEFMVIVAGYPKEMRNFLEANPGLMSRFDKQFHFEDYNETQLFEIAKMMFENEGLQMNTNAESYLKEHITDLLEKKHKYFGNARTIRKIVSKTVRKQNLRMADLPADKRTPSMISVVLREDITDSKIIEADNEERRGIGFR